ncbi:MULTISPECIES: DNA-3-methyladenine glycosylase [unclassified Knoellia]|uniref:DNA-3-methyladenine glycosylase n=1 Tax=Knoellia altitudinis TaxID=3404795 RepID=UPI00360A9136
MSRLARDFFARPVLDVAPELLGARLVHGDVVLRLTEVEAYAGTADPGSHAFRGPTPRTAVMFGPAGHLYVYFTYGMHWCANVVCGVEGEASAVLLRAGELEAGHDLVAQRRPGVTSRDLARGPARLARSLALDGTHTGADVCADDAEVHLLEPTTEVDRSLVRTGPRVGVSGPGGDGAAYPWRFWIDAEPTVSAYRPGVIRRRAR